jgi:hypothetical protein
MQSRDLVRVLGVAAASTLSVQHACPQRERALLGPTGLVPLACPLRDLVSAQGF